MKNENTKNDSELTNTMKDFENEFKNHKEQKFKEILFILIKITILVSILLLILAVVNQDIELAMRALRGWFIIGVFWYVYN